MNQPAGLFSRASLRRLLMFAVGTCVVPWGAATVGCGPSQPAADLKAPTNQEILPTAQCVGGHSSTTPDLMAWDSESRLNLSRLRNSGIVAVRYQAHGCDVQMELLSNCIAHGSYEFTPYVSKERKIAHDESELYAQLPLGAASLTGKVAGNQSVRTDYLLVGEHALAPDATFKLSDFQGADCARATHVISAVYVGGFALVTGNERDIDAAVTVFGAGGGAGQSESVDRLANEGDPDACERAQKTHMPDDACNVPLRVGLLPISDVIVAPEPVASQDAVDAGGGGSSNPVAASAPPGALLKAGWTPGQPLPVTPFLVVGGMGGTSGSAPSGVSGPPGISASASNNAPNSPTTPLGQQAYTTNSVNTPALRPAAAVQPQRPAPAAPAVRPPPAPAVQANMFPHPAPAPGAVRSGMSLRG